MFSKSTQLSIADCLIDWQFSKHFYKISSIKNHCDIQTRCNNDLLSLSRKFDFLTMSSRAASAGTVRTPWRYGPQARTAASAISCYLPPPHTQLFVQPRWRNFRLLINCAYRHYVSRAWVPRLSDHAIQRRIGPSVPSRAFADELMRVDQPFSVKKAAGDLKRHDVLKTLKKLSR